MSRSVVFWTSLDDVIALDDAALTAWHDNGVDGFVGNAGLLVGMGGSGPQWASRQAQIRSLRLIERAHALGMKLYLGCYMTNALNAKTPLGLWSSDANSAKVAGYLSQFAASARSLGFDGLAFDEEVYGTTATWAWNYVGNARTETATRAKVKLRGAQYGAAIAASWPGLVIIDTGCKLPGGWSERVQQTVNGANYANRVQVDLWTGIQSNANIARVVFLEPVFYKETQAAGVDWAEAIAYDRTAFAALASARGWSAVDRLDRIPFAWIDAGPNLPWEAARDPAHVGDQLAAFAAVGDVYIFSYTGVRPGRFDYSDYLPAIQAASAA